ncbi:MAG: hypothetical protein IPK19_25795 [Chloroflexi bacterium]|nr:hypothetical protein [Chloroflexota bacterium]
MPSIRLERARSALRILSIDQQEVLMFRLAQNLTLQDTASVMGRSIDAVRSLQLRAIEHLAEILDAVEDD